MKPYQKQATVTTSFVALESSRTVVRCEIGCAPGNTGNVTFKIGGNEKPWVAGEYHYFDCVDLNTIEIKGTADDKVDITGGA